ncbi:hypothetical protein pb186bvf_004085 [Paramecium bursaria]
MIKILPIDITLFSLAPVPILLIRPWSASWTKTSGYLVILLIQIFLFFYLRFPNCYETLCPEIQSSFERKLFYEKYQTLNPDLNEIRGEGFQYQSIFKVLNNLISIFMLVISFSQKGRFINSINSIFFVKLLISTFEVNTILSNDLPKRIFNLTLFEQAAFLKVIQITLLLIVREICGIYFQSDADLIQKSLQEQQEKKMINHEQEDEILKICQNLRIEPKDGLFSTKNTYYAIFFISIILLFKN